ncbi:MAG: hypothetical protein LIO90_04710 [Bacteroidales bacterium]|nr:hypothetical protein [Bacteroidales bacterium]
MKLINRVAAVAAFCTLSFTAMGQQLSDFGFHFYGRIRADLFYNTRANNETVDGLFYMYPKDNLYDPNGKDLNATPQGNMYSLYTRLGVDITGPNIGSAKSAAKVELDFRGGGSTYSIARIRHAYVTLSWEHQDVLIGQTWHPLFGEVSPSILNLSTGAPFQPFNRSPLVRYRYHLRDWQFTGALVWQMQYTNAGPDGKSHNYLKNSCIPEIFIGIDYKHGPWIAGVGGELLSLKPRLSATVGDQTYKVDERVTSLSAEAHVRYKKGLWQVGAKTALANNLTQCSMLGGFGVTYTSSVNGQMDYTPFRHSATWVNVVYGKKWQPGLFVGYLKNLGTGKEITGPTYGVGLDVDQLLSVNAQISYNLPCWKLGLEVEPSTAWYGSLNKKNGHIVDTHSVTNWRFLCAVMYIF